jgi:hypothetical protein
LHKFKKENDLISPFKRDKIPEKTSENDQKPKNPTPAEIPTPAEPKIQEKPEKTLQHTWKKPEKANFGKITSKKSRFELFKEKSVGAVPVFDSGRKSLSTKKRDFRALIGKINAVKNSADKMSTSPIRIELGVPEA